MAIEAESRGKKMIAAMNRMPEVGKTEDFLPVAEKVIEAGIHGIILNDAGLIHRLRQHKPEVYIMASIGLSPINRFEARFYADVFVDTVLLSEFLSVEEIIEIRKDLPIGIEFFARGLKEFGYTGKCILSSYFHQCYINGTFKGSAKRGGICQDVCRKKFRLDYPLFDFGLSQSEAEITLPLNSFLLIETFDLLLPYVDVFKIWQGDLKENQLLDIIKMFREKVNMHRISER